jgi:hypothetical protein
MEEYYYNVHLSQEMEFEDANREGAVWQALVSMTMKVQVTKN